jgi:Ser/Thr protein kinase RdoA (MazF antagonist)
LFVWRDPRPDHILFEQEMVTGLLDFGGAGIDSAAVDLARLLPEWTTNHPSARSEALAAYETIRPLQPSEQRVLEALELSGPIMLGGRWLSWWFLGAPPRSPACLDPRRVLWGLRRALEGLEAVDTSRMIV